MFPIFGSFLFLLIEILQINNNRIVSDYRNEFACTSHPYKGARHVAASVTKFDLIYAYVYWYYTCPERQPCYKIEKKNWKSENARIVFLLNY